MQVQLIENRNSKLGFNSNAIEQASNFVNMDNSELRYLAYKSSYDPKKEQENRKSIVKTLYTIPVAETIAAGVLTKSVLSDKVVSAAKKAGSWAGVIALVSLYSSVKNAIVSKSPSLQNFQQQNPFLALLADIGIISTSFIFGRAGIANLKDKVLKKYPDKVDKYSDKVADVKKWLNKTKLNKEILPKISAKLGKIAEKAPWAAKAGKFALLNSMWIILGVAALKAIKHSKDSNKKIEENYRALKKAQLKTSRDLVNILGTQNNILVQNQEKLVKNQKTMLRVLRKTLKTEPIMPKREIAIIREKAEIIPIMNEAEQNF